MSIALAVGFAYYLVCGGSVYGTPAYFRALQVLTLALTALVSMLVAFTTLAWSRPYWTLSGRIYYTLVTLAGAAFVWLLNFWNLLGFHG